MSSYKTEKGKELIGYISRILRAVGQADVSPSYSIYHFRGGEKYPLIIRACMGPMLFEETMGPIARKRYSYVVEVLSMRTKDCWFRFHMFPKVGGGHSFRIDVLLEGPWVEQLMDLDKQVASLKTTRDLSNIR